MKIGLTEMTITWEDRVANKIEAEEIMKEAAAVAVELLIFPEMTLTGFTMNAEAQEGFEGDLNFFQEMSVKYGMAMAFGAIKKTQEGFANKLVVVDKGQCVMDYTKLHPFSYSGEDEVFTPGDALSTVRFGSVRIGGYVCYDLRFPDIFTLGSPNYDALMVIANWPASRKSQWEALLRARAIENQAYAIGVNCVGAHKKDEYVPSSMAFDNLGNRIDKRHSEKLLVADLDVNVIKDAREKFPVMKDRRPDLYKVLAE